MVFKFPPDHDSAFIDGKVRGQPFSLDTGGFPSDEASGAASFGGGLGLRNLFLARVKRQISGVWYYIQRHVNDRTYDGRLLRAYWLREQADDPALDAGAIVVGGRDRRGRFCFQRTPEIYVAADAINRVDEANPEVAYASSDSCSNTGAASSEERLLIHFPSAVTVLWDSDYAHPNLGIRAYHDVDFVIDWGAGPTYATYLDVGYGTQMRLITSDFTPASVTWKWCYTDGNLSLGTDVASFTDLYEFDPPWGWDLTAGKTTAHSPDKNPIGDNGTEVGGFGSWNPSDTTCYGVELRHVAPTVDGYSGGTEPPTMNSYTHAIQATYLTTIAWRKLWWI